MDAAVEVAEAPVEERHPLGWTETILHGVRARLQVVSPVVLRRAGARGVWCAEHQGQRYRVERKSPRDLWEVWRDDGAGELLWLTRTLAGAREAIGRGRVGGCIDLAGLRGWAIFAVGRSCTVDDCYARLDALHEVWHAEMEVAVAEKAREVEEAVAVRRRAGETPDDAASGWLGA